MHQPNGERSGEQHPAFQPGRDVERLLQELVERLGQSGRARTIFGEPVERNGVTVIPVAKARWGFGGGFGRGSGQGQIGGGGGGGGGIVVSPVGYIEIRPDHTRFRPIMDWGSLLPPAISAATVLVLGWRLLGRR